MTTGWNGPGGPEPEADPFADFDAAYLFGALAPEDRAAYERHLQHCDACSDSVAAMAGVPGLLARVPLERIIGSSPGPAPDTLLPKLVAEVGHERFRSRRRAGAAIFLAAACVLALLVGLIVSRHNGRTTAAGLQSGSGTATSSQSSPATTSTTPTISPPTASAGPELNLAPVGRVSVNASVQIQSVLWGTRITMKCHEKKLAGKLPHPGWYYLVLVGRDQSRREIASWQTLPGKTVHIEGDTGWPRSSIASVLLVDDDHDVLLKLAL